MQESILQLGRWPSLQEVQLRGCVIREETLASLHQQSPHLVIWHDACEAQTVAQVGP